MSQMSEDSGNNEAKPAVDQPKKGETLGLLAMGFVWVVIFGYALYSKVV